MEVTKYICDITGQEVKSESAVRIITSVQKDPVDGRKEYGDRILHLSQEGAIDLLKRLIVNYLSVEQQIALNQYIVANWKVQ